MYRNFWKPIFDFLVAGIAFVLISPVFFLLMIVIKLSSDGPVFFIHSRPGYKRKVVKIIKFRTMNDKKDSSGKLMANKFRITKTGSFLRKFSLDELPQLINVLKGDISLVGPRPLEMRYLPYYTPEQDKRHNVKPGITGWAQINGRNLISWENRFEFDIWYVDNISFRLDMNILLRTFIKAIRSEGINSDSDNTMIPLDVYIESKKKKEIYK